MKPGKKSILIITPYFAPQTHAAVFRAHKLARYLPEYNWKVHVLTVDTNYLYNEDPGLLNELPEDVDIHRARYVEPTMRGVRMLLGGTDRTYSVSKTQRSNQVESPRSGSDTPRWNTPGRVYNHILRRWFSYPDKQWTWYWPAVSLGRHIVHEHHIDLVYSSSLPHTSHRIAMELQTLGPRWVADFRDPVTYGYKWSSRFDRIRNRQQQLVREFLATADVVTALSSSYQLIFNDLYGPITRQPIEFIPTGIDDCLVPDADEITSDPDSPYIVFVGEVMPESTSEFFAVFAKAANRTTRPFRMKVIGNISLNWPRLAPVLETYGLMERVEFIDHLPQRDLYRQIAGATAAVLAPGPTNHWWNNHAKLVDYVGLRKPVLAVVPDPSEARSVLTRARLGVFLDGPEPQAVQALIDFLNGDISLPQPNEEECDRYLASTQVRRFAELFDRVLDR